MSKKLFYLIAIALMIAVSSCNKNANEPEVEREPESNEFLAEIAAPETQNAPSTGMTTKTTIAGKVVTWQTNDQICINGETDIFTCTVSGSGTTTRAYFSGESPYQREKYHAIYSETVTDFAVDANLDNPQGNLSATQVIDSEHLSDNLPMYAYNTNHWLTFHNICAAVKITVPCAADRIEVSNTTAALNGAFTISDNKAVMHTDNVQPAEKIITVTKTGGFAADEIVYVAIPEGSYSNFCVSFYNNGSSTPVMSTGVSKKAFAVTADKIYNVTLKFPGLLSAGFTVAVDASGNPTKRVLFTNGNLWYNSNNQTTHFEDTQISYPEIGSLNTSHVGHFTWNTTIANSSTAERGYSNSTDPNDFFAKSVTVDGVEYTTLSKAEWECLLGEGSSVRSGATSKRKCNVTVDGEKCLVIAPDTSTATLSSTMTLAYCNSYGLVCLPYAGFHNDNGVISNSYNTTTPLLRYHTLTSCTGADYKKAYTVFRNADDESGNYINANPQKNSGRCIRLVKVITSGN